MTTRRTASARPARPWISTHCYDCGKSFTPEVQDLLDRIDTLTADDVDRLNSLMSVDHLDCFA